MTEQEITQARSDLEQLGIEQLRCGVMLQLLKIEALTKERDEYKLLGDVMLGGVEAVQAANQRLDGERDALALGVDQWRVDYHELRLEFDALMAAGKLALEALNYTYHDDGNYSECLVALKALREAGVQ